MVLRRHSVHNDDVVTSEASSVREPFGVGQAICVALGVFFLVIGAIGLARTGLNDLTGETTEVAGMGMTALLSLIAITLGVLSLIGAASRGSARGMLMFLGPALIAMGIIALIEPVDELGWNDTNGVVYLIAGAIAILGAVLTPTAIVAERHRDTTRHAA